MPMLTITLGMIDAYDILVIIEKVTAASTRVNINRFLTTVATDSSILTGCLNHFPFTSPNARLNKQSLQSIDISLSFIYTIACSLQSEQVELNSNTRQLFAHSKAEAISFFVCGVNHKLTCSFESGFI